MKGFLIFCIIILTFNGYCWDVANIPRNNFSFINKYRFAFIKPLKKGENIVQTKEEQNFNLTGVIKIGNDYFAIINNNSYGLNSFVNGYKIVNIDMTKVVLTKNKSRVVLYVDKN
ncbi:hypothetical protein OWM07_08325 [Deferribacter thermophilus]|uniref:hypothetical protein n=1 Tax=Deferribacter thermophilus TaxID=53573 RepID=UPI003C1BF745